MYKAVLISLVTFTLQQNANAWSFDVPGVGTVKGDDPQVVKDVGNGLKHAGNQIANGVRDTFAVVGNATGITDIIESNIETFTIIGRTHACLRTLCYSEVLLKQQTVKAEEEAKKEYDEAVKKYVNEREVLDQESRLKDAYKIMKSSKDRVAALEMQYKLTELENNNITALLNAIVKENEYRNKLAANNVQGRPLKNREMIPAAEEFSKNYMQNFEGAMKTLNDKIDMLTKTTKRSHMALMAEFIRIVEKNVLDYLAEEAKGQRLVLRDETDLLLKKLQLAKEEYFFAEKNYEQEKKNYENGN